MAFLVESLLTNWASPDLKEVFDRLGIQTVI